MKVQGIFFPGEFVILNENREEISYPVLHEAFIPDSLFLIPD